MKNVNMKQQQETAGDLQLSLIMHASDLAVFLLELLSTKCVTGIEQGIVGNIVGMK